MYEPETSLLCAALSPDRTAASLPLTPFRRTKLLATVPLPQWSTTRLTQPRGNLSAAAVGSKVLFGGGSNGTPSTVVDIYDTLLGVWSVSEFSAPHVSGAAAALGDLLLFAGGIPSTAVVDIYEVNAGMWSRAELEEPRGYLAAVTAGVIVMFGGGRNVNESDLVDVYDASTKQWSLQELRVARSHLAAASCRLNRSYVAAFAGGIAAGIDVAMVDIFTVTDSTIEFYFGYLSLPRHNLVGAAVGTKLLFAGGQVDTGAVDTVDIYEASNNSWSTAQLSVARSGLVAATVGTKYGHFSLFFFFFLFLVIFVCIYAQPHICAVI